jgi:uncharacterized lipoprotein YajG
MMTRSTSPFRLAIGVAVMAGSVLLAGCAAKPYSQTTSSEQTTITTPAQPTQTTTTTTTDHSVQHQ